MQSWADKSSLAAIYVQNYTGLPSFSSPGGIAGVDFDLSSTEIMGSGTDVLQAGDKGFMCLAVVTMNSASSLPLFFAVNNNQTPQLLGFGASQDAFAGSYGNLFMSCSADGSTQFGFFSTVSGGFASLNGVRVLISYTYDGSGWSNSNPGGFGIYLNGASLSLSVAASTGTIEGQNTVGGWGDNGNRFAGTVHEVIYCNTTVNNGLRQQAEAYLTAKWAL